MTSRLSPLQERILRVVAGVEPQPVVTGGAALAGFHTCHRTTRDVDAFWRGRDSLGELPQLVLDRLADAGLSVSVIQRTRAFLQARITFGNEVCLLDLVAEPVAAIGPPEFRMLGETRVAIDSAHGSSSTSSARCSSGRNSAISSTSRRWSMRVEIWSEL